MKKSVVWVLLSILMSCSMESGSADPEPDPNSDGNVNIIADHTVVEKYDDIPDVYLNEAKKMWVNFPGRSHSRAYMKGLMLLEQEDARFAVQTFDQYHVEASADFPAPDGDTPETAGTTYLRSSGALRSLNYNRFDYSTNALSFWSTAEGVAKVKNHIDYVNGNGYGPHVMGFAWCWDLVWKGESPEADPVYGCHWFGTGNPDTETDATSGEGGWFGLDSGDSAINMQTYLEQMADFMDYCKENDYQTTMVLTTGPVDDYNGEKGYQGHLKNQYIRDYVSDHPDAGLVLFDFADILATSDSGEDRHHEWNGTEYPAIHTDNDAAGDNDPGYHISAEGAVRLAKAQWWMLARIAGWDGN